MIRRSIFMVMFTFMIILAGSFAVVLAASNTVPPSGASSRTYPITPNDLKPSQCAGINLTNLVAGGGKLDGTSGNDLILGSNKHDDLNGLGGNDCLVSGAGADNLSGGDGDDVLIGGNGNDQIDGGPGNDACFGENGNDHVSNCESWVP